MAKTGVQFKTISEKWCACIRYGELVTPYKSQRFPVKD
jgi:hypothetical protein